MTIVPISQTRNKGANALSKCLEVTQIVERSAFSPSTLSSIPCIWGVSLSLRFAVTSGVSESKQNYLPWGLPLPSLLRPHFHNQRELLLVEPAPMSSSVFNLWLPYPITTSLCPSPCLSVCLSVSGSKPKTSFTVPSRRLPCPGGSGPVSPTHLPRESVPL